MPTAPLAHRTLRHREALLNLEISGGHILHKAGLNCALMKMLRDG